MIILAAGAAAVLLVLAGIAKYRNRTPEKVVLGYVTSWSEVMPDPALVTHLNYAFGHVADSFDAVRIDNEGRLAEIAALKKAQPSLRVLLSIGGWGSGRFSEMAASDLFRTSFCASCKAAMDSFGLDGIDIDWEYPTKDWAGISAAPEDTDNFTLLMRDLRTALGPKALLTVATAAGAEFIDFKAIIDYVDLVNVMSYDMGFLPPFNAALYNSPLHSGMTTDRAVKAHLEAGVPKDKLVVGIPFFGHGNGKDFKAFSNFNIISIGPEYNDCWDGEARVPYVTDKDGNVVLSYDNVRSITEKCQYVMDNGLRGAMYWECAADDADLTLAKTVRENIARK